MAAVGIYLAVALPTMGRLRMLGLVLANSAQWLGHATIMLILAPSGTSGTDGRTQLSWILSTTFVAQGSRS